ncbi:hypothetical protein [Zobellella sp. DQSA1]|uniref:hypothetical protein n=1 Tax=Zobellella sp. DQSA1 TaxID=3342386 RepID=UPI0035BF1371
MKRHCLLVSALTFSASVSADFFQEMDTQAGASAQSKGPWQHRAWVQQVTGFGYRSPASNSRRSRPDFSRAETQLYGQLGWQSDTWRLRLAGGLVHDWLPDLEQRTNWSGDQFSDTQADARQWRFEPADSYISWQGDRWWIRGGYQTLAWGQAESQRITDVLSRRDQRWPGQEELKDMRLPVPAVRIALEQTLDIVLLPSMPADRAAAAGEEFDLYGQWRDTRIETHRGDNPGWALRWSSNVPGWDFQGIVADTYSFERYPSITFQDNGQPGIELSPWRQQMLGVVIQAGQRNWVWRTEQAWLWGVRVMPNDPTKPWSEHEQWRAMVSGEYSGIQNLTLTFEVSSRWTRDHHEGLSEDAWQTGFNVRVAYRMMNDQLTLTSQVVGLPGGQGEIFRTSADWDLSDNWGLGLAWVDYRATRETDQLYPFRHNDTLLFTARRNF